MPKSATLPKWAMLFLIRQSQIQNNSIIHCFTWMIICCLFVDFELLIKSCFARIWEYLIYVTLIFETKQHALFSKLKKMKNRLIWILNFYTNHTVNLFCTRSKLFKWYDNEWCEGKHSPTMNKVYTKEKKPLRLLNSKEFSKFMLTNLAWHCPFGQCCQFGQFVWTVWTGQVIGD